jgi:hypothetical protein
MFNPEGRPSFHTLLNCRLRQRDCDYYGGEDLPSGLIGAATTLSSQECDGGDEKDDEQLHLGVSEVFEVQVDSCCAWMMAGCPRL